MLYNIHIYYILITYTVTLIQHCIYFPMLNMFYIVCIHIYILQYTNVFMFYVSVFQYYV